MGFCRLESADVVGISPSCESTAPMPYADVVLRQLEPMILRNQRYKIK